MKKFCTILILGLLLAGPSFSQHFFIGVNGSVMNTWITDVRSVNMPDMDYKTTFNPAVALNVGLQITNHLAIEIQPGYQVLGQKLSDAIGDTTYSRTITLNYFQLPIFLKYRTGGALAKFFIEVGPQFNMLMSAKQTYMKKDSPWDDPFTNPNTHKSEARNTSDIKSHFNSMDIMARMDFGVEFVVIKKLMIDAGINLGYGLTDINSADWKIKNSSGKYTASHNIFGGATIGVNYVF